MSYLLRDRVLAPVVLFFLVLAPAVGLGAAPRLRIKNGRGLNVSLGKTREAAIGIRPDKNVWTLELDAGVVGADADFRDVTPDVASAHWNLPVETDHLVLDATRFLASHVYRLELRRDRKLLGGAFIYLYPPPPPDPVSHVDLESQSEATDKDAGPAPMPKGSL